MRKIEDHGPYCGCTFCKPRDVTDPSEVETGDWPLIKPDPERPAPPKQRRTAFFASVFTVFALGCCWATPPTMLETYRETMAMARECSHRPACMSRPFHEQRLAVDEHCYHGPKCVRLEDCFKKHVEGVFAMGCDHAPACSSSLGHFNALRRFQGLAPITLP